MLLGLQRTPLAGKVSSFVGESIKLMLEAGVAHSGAVASARVTAAPAKRGGASGCLPFCPALPGGVRGRAASWRAEGLMQSQLPAVGRLDLRSAWDVPVFWL